MTLLKFIRTSGNARKIFGAREIKIIEKQLMGAALTQSEKNRLSRDIRVKLNFISKAARFENEFKLKKGAEVKRIIADTTDIIRSDKDSKKIKKIFLYGSANDNSRTLRSDIDIAVDLKADKREATIFRKRISGKTHNLVDIQVLGTLPEKIKKEILSSGKILYSR